MHNIIFDENDMKVIIGDIKLEINIHDYINALTKYDSYIRTIYFLGGGATAEHIIKLLSNDGYKKSKIYKILNEMVVDNFLKKQSLGKYNIFILTKKSMIYFKKKNDVGQINLNNPHKVMKSLLLADFIVSNIGAMMSNLVTINKNDNKEYNVIANLKQYYHFQDYDRIILLLIRNLYVRLNKINNKYLNKEYIHEQFYLNKKEDQRVIYSTNSRKVIQTIKVYDDLFKLKLSDTYLFNVEINNDNVVMEFLVLDIDRPLKWFRKIIFKVDSIIKNIFFYPVPGKNIITVNFTILSENEERNEAIKNNVNKLIQEIIFESNKSIATKLNRYSEYKNNLPKPIAEKEGIKEGDYFLHSDELENISIWDNTLFTVGSVRGINYDTERFFRTKSDDVNYIGEDRINIIDIK